MGFIGRISTTIRRFAAGITLSASMLLSPAHAEPEKTLEALTARALSSPNGMFDYEPLARTQKGIENKLHWQSQFVRSIYDIPPTKQNEAAKIWYRRLDHYARSHIYEQFDDLVQRSITYLTMQGKTK